MAHKFVHITANDQSVLYAEARKSVHTSVVVRSVDSVEGARYVPITEDGAIAKNAVAQTYACISAIGTHVKSVTGARDVHTTALKLRASNVVGLRFVSMSDTAKAAAGCAHMVVV